MVNIEQWMNDFLNDSELLFVWLQTWIKKLV